MVFFSFQPFSVKNYRISAHDYSVFHRDTGLKTPGKGPGYRTLFLKTEGFSEILEIPGNRELLLQMVCFMQIRYGGRFGKAEK
jgi:hypothetical protein